MSTTNDNSNNSNDRSTIQKCGYSNNRNTNSDRHSKIAINISIYDDRQHNSNTCSNNRNRNGTTKMKLVIVVIIVITLIARVIVVTPTDFFARGAHQKILRNDICFGLWHQLISVRPATPSEVPDGLRDGPDTCRTA